jgi:hypothetical protein
MPDDDRRRQREDDDDTDGDPQRDHGGWSLSVERARAAWARY